MFRLLWWTLLGGPCCSVAARLVGQWTPTWCWAASPQPPPPSATSRQTPPPLWSPCPSTRTQTTGGGGGGCWGGVGGGVGEGVGWVRVRVLCGCGRGYATIPSCRWEEERGLVWSSEVPLPKALATVHCKVGSLSAALLQTPLPAPCMQACRPGMGSGFCGAGWRAAE